MMQGTFASVLCYVSRSGCIFYQALLGSQTNMDNNAASSCYEHCLCHCSYGTTSSVGFLDLRGGCPLARLQQTPLTGYSTVQYYCTSSSPILFSYEYRTSTLD